MKVKTELEELFKDDMHRIPIFYPLAVEVELHMTSYTKCDYYRSTQYERISFYKPVSKLFQELAKNDEEYE